MQKKKSIDDMRKLQRKPTIEALPPERGEALAKDLPNIVTYLECSAKTGEGVKEVFEDAIRAVINPNTKKRPSQGCKIF